MNILIVSSHPEPASLSNALRDLAAEQLRTDGHHVRISDLHELQWKAVVDRQDFPGLDPTERLRVPAASGEAFVHGTLTKDVVAEQDKLMWADALILAFPLWWFSVPAILKGWIDRVYSYGFAYGVGEHNDRRWGDRYGEGSLAGKRAMLIVTAGGWATHYGPRGINGPIDDLLFPINHGVLFYPGYDVLPAFVVYEADRIDEPRFRATEIALRGRMRRLFDDAPIAFRRQNAGDYLIPAMELKPSLSPGVRGFGAHLKQAVTSPR